MTVVEDGNVPWTEIRELVAEADREAGVGEVERKPGSDAATTAEDSPAGI